MVERNWLGELVCSTLVPEEEEVELEQLIVACRVVNNEMLKLAKDPPYVAGTRVVINHLLDLALEKVIGDEVIQPHHRKESEKGELPY